MLASYLIAVVVKSSLWLAAGLVGLRFLRKADAALRHSVCLVALAGAVSTLLLALWNPQWSIAIPISAVAAVSSGGNGAAPVLQWPTIVSAAWSIGALAILCRLIAGLSALALARRRSVPFLNREGIDVRISRVSVPLTSGVFRPLVLLPESARGWDELRLRAVLLHELAHVRRRDCLAKHLAQWSRALLWWNPLVWVVAARLDHEQELACDAAVLASGVAADAYANVLLDAARECSSSLLLSCAMQARPSTALQQRFAHLFAWRNEPRASSRRIAFALPVLLVLLTGVSCAEKIYKIGPGIVAPKVLQKTDPNYTDQARAAKIEGPVVLSIVVGTDQRAHDIKVTKSLDPGMDANAIAAIKAWQFQPGTRKGKPVPVRATIQVNFKLL